MNNENALTKKLKWYHIWYFYCNKILQKENERNKGQKGIITIPQLRKENIISDIITVRKRIRNKMK